MDSIQRGPSAYPIGNRGTSRTPNRAIDAQQLVSIELMFTEYLKHFVYKNVVHSGDLS